MTGERPRRYGQTPSQTVGPFFSFSLGRLDLTEVFPGQGTITLAGTVTDGEGAPVPDAVVELWQADAAGTFAPGGFGRSCTDPEGRYHFTTVVPGPVAAADGTPQAPHVTLVVFARGLLRHAFTRAYLVPADGPDGPDGPEGAAAADPVLAAVPPARRRTLLAHDEGDGRYRFDVRLQGPDETVFFDV